jgi:hypothetical protein
MTKGRATYETTLEIQNDPKSEITDEERALHYQQTRQLFDMSEDLAYLVYQIDQWRDAAQALDQAGKLGKREKKALDEINAFKETLVVTTGDNYVGAAKPQLRGKIATLYGKVAGSFRPAAASDQASMNLLAKQLEDAMQRFDQIKSKEFDQLAKALQKAELPNVEIMDKQSFLNS